jgi:predicted nucleic acid-binding protein
VRLFLDSSVLLAASGSSKGASRLLITEAIAQGWELRTSHYCFREVEHNIVKMGLRAEKDWAAKIYPQVQVAELALVLDRPLIYPIAKDRPVVISALSDGADCLLTLDRADFHDLLGSSVYAMKIRTPGEFLREEWQG